MLEIVILAAGKGTRMRSNLPKVLHQVAGKALLQHVLDTSAELNADKVITVVGHGAERVKNAIDAENLVFVQQSEQLGTGHAVQQASPEISSDSIVLVLYGDVPLIKKETLSKLIQLVSDKSMGLLTVNLADPAGYGRIVRNGEGDVEAIVEQKDASAAQLAINEVNSGVMAITSEKLKSWLPRLQNNNAQGEYYLTDIIALAVADGISVQTCQPDSESEVMGINNRAQQAMVERLYQHEYVSKLMAQGLTLADPARFDCRGSLDHGQDCFVDINCVFEGKNRLGNSVTIGPNCTFINADIGDDTVIAPNSIIENSRVGEGCTIGPYARLRPGTELKAKAKIGNFVETKKAIIGEGSKINHLSYVGDAKVGNDVNIGAGTITCNYDGANKHKTTIADNVFVGSNTALVAPITIGEGATIGAGATITSDVEEGVLAISRAKQRSIEGWKRPIKKK